MAIKSSGSLSMTEIVNEFGGSVPHSLSEYYRNGGRVPANNTSVPTSGTISIGNFYGAVNEIQYTISSNTTNFQLSSAYGSNWQTAVPKRLIVNSGVTVGSSNGNPAMTIEGSMGGTLIVQNTGSIQGTGGSANGGNGGSAVRSDQNGNITFYNNSGGQVYAGGGGGGKGGTGGTGGQGGTGGTGGAGQYQSYVGASSMFTQYPHNAGPLPGSYFCGVIFGWHTFGNITGYQQGTKSRFWWHGRVTFSCYANNAQSGGNGGSGGSGGSGGAGGDGGRGQGYGQSAQNGSGGSAGGAGSGGNSGGAGTNNAGAGGTGGTGGQGGTGGTGGNGGSWGTDGGDGNQGNTGLTGITGNPGANGNNGTGAGGSGGSGGSAGAGGSGGGNKGYYIQNRHYMTFHNSGSVAGS